MPMDERAQMYMCGTPEGVMLDEYTDGPTRYSMDLTNDMPDGHVLVGKSNRGTKLIFREQKIDGRMVPFPRA